MSAEDELKKLRGRSQSNKAPMIPHAIILEDRGDVHHVMIHPTAGEETGHHVTWLFRRFLKETASQHIEEYEKREPKFVINNEFALWLETQGYTRAIYSVG